MSTMTIASHHDLPLTFDRMSGDVPYALVQREQCPDAVLLPRDIFEGLMETVYLLKNPANAAHLATSIEQYRKGELVERDLIDA